MQPVSTVSIYFPLIASICFHNLCHQQWTEISHIKDLAKFNDNFSIIVLWNSPPHSISVSPWILPYPNFKRGKKKKRSCSYATYTPNFISWYVNLDPKKVNVGLKFNAMCSILASLDDYPQSLMWFIGLILTSRELPTLFSTLTSLHSLQSTRKKKVYFKAV